MTSAEKRQSWTLICDDGPAKNREFTLSKDQVRYGYWKVAIPSSVGAGPHIATYRIDYTDEWTGLVRGTWLPEGKP